MLSAHRTLAGGGQLQTAGSQPIEDPACPTSALAEPPALQPQTAALGARLRLPGPLRGLSLKRETTWRRRWPPKPEGNRSGIAPGSAWVPLTRSFSAGRGAGCALPRAGRTDGPRDAASVSHRQPSFRSAASRRSASIGELPLGRDLALSLVQVAPAKRVVRVACRAGAARRRQLELPPLLARERRPREGLVLLRVRRCQKSGAQLVPPWRSPRPGTAAPGCARRRRASVRSASPPTRPPRRACGGPRRSRPSRCGRVGPPRSPTGERAGRGRDSRRLAR